ncbi:MAG: hypothetical protein ACJ8D6_09150 [Sphingomicrobium sp.]
MKVRRILANETGRALQVMVEPWPDRYNLRAGEKLELVYEPIADQPFEIVVLPESIALYPDANSLETLIDGKPAEGRSWTD